MASQYVSRAFMEINGVELEFDEIEYELNKNTERVNNMNRENRTKGFIRPIPEISITGTISLPQGGLALDLDALALSNSEFPVSILYDDGKARTFTDCTLDRVSVKSAHGEKTEYSIEIMATDMQAS